MQAEVDAIRLESAQAQLLLVQERELIKTRALKARLERDKVIIGVIQDIAREKIRGAAERANITHRYLQEIKEQYDTFNSEVQEKYDELQRLEALNQAIVDAIAAHDEAIQANIVRAEALERQNQQKIDELIRQEPTPDSTSTPIPAPSVADEIEKLADLLDRGLLTQDEFIPGRYVGAEAQEEDADEPFEEKMARLAVQWRVMEAEAAKLDAAIKENLNGLGFG